MKQGMHTEFW